jgi:hypothetical protein
MQLQGQEAPEFLRLLSPVGLAQNYHTSHLELLQIVVFELLESAGSS